MTKNNSNQGNGFGCVVLMCPTFFPKLIVVGLIIYLLNLINLGSELSLLKIQ